MEVEKQNLTEEIKEGPSERKKVKKKKKKKKIVWGHKGSFS